MRFPSTFLGCVLAAPIVSNAFLPSSLLKQTPTSRSIIQTNDAQIQLPQHQQSPWSSSDYDCSMTQLNMAFTGSEKDSNIFDGPMALTKERDACGVGFIANTKSGGTCLTIYIYIYI